MLSSPRHGRLFPPEIPANDRSANVGAILIYHGGPGGIAASSFNDADTKILSYEDTGLPLPPFDAQVGEEVGDGPLGGRLMLDVVIPRPDRFACAVVALLP